MKDLRVGFVGMGAMGAPMALNLLKAGYEVTVHNRTREREEPVAEAGARRADSPAQASADADIVITCVSDVPDVKEVICGPDGVLEGIRAESLVMDMSTIGPVAARDIDESCRQSNVRFVDAPVSGGVGGAQAGTLSIMVGGSREDVEYVLPVLQAMGETIVHFGPVGAGQSAKLVNQVIGGGALAAAAEGLVLARMLGLDLDQVVEAISGGAAGSWMLKNLGPKMAHGDLAGGFKTGLHQKDIRLVLEASEAAGMRVALTRLVQQFFAAAEAKGHRENGTQSIITGFEDLVMEP